MLEKRRNTIPEILGPLVDTPDGRKMYENYEIALEDGIYTCLTCGFVTGAHYKENWRRLQVIKVHVKAKHLNAYRCHLCEKNFTTHKCHQHHLQRMHPPEITLLRLCDLCGKSVSNLPAHLWHHKSPAEQREVIQSGKGFAILTCDKCGKEFKGFDKLAAHQTIGYRCKRSDLPRPLDSGSNRTLPCPTCRKPVFLSNITQHEWTHKSAEEKEESVRLGTAPMVPCRICGKFVPHTGFKKHLETHKQPEERTSFRCEWDGCSRQFSGEEFLIRHTKIDHEGVAISIGRKDRKVGEAGSFQCPYPSCSSRFFTTHPNLQDHIRRLHKFKIRAERPIKCDICQARFLINNDLTKHLKNHRPRADFILTCPHCPMLFACPHILRRHLTAEHGVPRVTTAERCRRYNERRKTQAPPGAQPFTCDICHVSYPIKTGLTHHLKNHRPRDDYTLTCSHCPALFATSKGLRCHLTKEHAVPKESNSTRQKIYHALRKQARGEKAVVKGDKVLQKHITKMHSLGRLTTHICDLCGKTVSNISAHLWGHKTPEEKEAAIQSGKGFLSCDKCGKEFSGQDRLAAHLTQGNRCKGNKDYAESDTSNPSYRKIPYRICARPVTVYGHAQHEWTHKNEAEKEESIRLGTSPKVRCEICKIHVFHNAYKAHFETHKKPEEMAQFRCEWAGCGRKFGRKYYLNLHVKTMHPPSDESGESSSAGLRCPEPSCSSLRFTSQPNLKSHIARRHENKVRAERPLKCDICRTGFVVRIDMTRHKRNHLPPEEYTLPCPHCPILFAKPNLLRRHLTMDHSAPKENRWASSEQSHIGRKKNQGVQKRLANGESRPAQSRPSSSRVTRSRTKIEHIPDDEVEIKQEDCTIRDVLSSEEDDDDVEEANNYGTKDEIKSEDEDCDLNNRANFSPFSDVKSEHESDSDMDAEGEHIGFKMLAFDGNNSYSSDEDDAGEDPLKLECE